MTRLYAALLSSHVAAGLSGALAMLLLVTLKRGWFNDAVFIGTGFVLTLVLVRKFKRMEAEDV